MSKPSTNTFCNKFEFEICGKIYKRHSGLANHKITIKDANVMKPTAYDLPEKAIEEICTESQFFGVFKGYIHNYYPKTGNYKCIFKGINFYSTLSKVLGDDNWGVKYFLQHQKTFVLSYQQPSNPNDPDPLLELNLCQEPDPLQKQNQVKIYKAKKCRICKLKPIQIIIGWKRKEKSDVRNIVYSSGFIFINFTISRMRDIENLY
ncbi:hypothetical protein GLOIN_2v1786004 [Rhizophagus irregularis DAOM 181602=DAOM 197198]|nr:hypothetical protein GLOIN_2v1786004 [Rhizophagus irregularis DAOM 181602=DAOM 197198]POG61944.1 hypothetical protein GLOIN_2v1786004 [Rhizophagus irregularis DAOM 181602=DAOM 197198]GET56258.1 hypothetical protein GLOIN_2v1786004 [Rhizophagus irregularis DAOM 181602=DAOM 197198]|eukprot:XP_025168810.1 hypothetical protein GLOIN_2v1786004 [Rhizophagus irregularis DAOM 181602=DAOM 197198]